MKAWTGLNYLRITPIGLAWSCERGNKPLGSIKGGKYVDHLNDYYLMKKDSVGQLMAEVTGFML
jgi:hypothetical protein